MKKLFPILLLLPAFAAGSIAFTITSPTLQFTPPGGISNPNCMNGDVSCLIFSGNIDSDLMVDYFINGIQIDFLPATVDLVNNDNFFFFGPPVSAPGFFMAGDPTYSGPIFEIDISFNALPGIYDGTATLLGGPNGPSDMLPLVSDNFTIVVTPEPAAVWLTVLGLVAFAGFRIAGHRLEVSMRTTR